MRLLVTGGCGFIGSNFIRRRLTGTDDSIVNLDALTYAANPGNLADIAGGDRYRFVEGRVEDAVAVNAALTGVDAAVHFAAESHVDRSIADAAPFITTNVLGTQVLLDGVRHAGVARFVHVSTDEVYGALGAEGVFTESTPFRPRSPYAASKAAGDMLAQAAYETWHLPVSIVRPSNNYGPYQFPEKFIPVMVTNLVEGRKIPIYGRGENVRDWLYVEDCCQAIDLVLERGRPGEAYNVGGASERRNIEVARMVIGEMGRGEESIEYVPDRPGHDFRYALDNAKISRELGWKPATRFEDGLNRTVAWYREHPEWWRPLLARLDRAAQGFWTGHDRPGGKRAAP
ncbi:MAG TPA: dTDP-glucose 4,6-dehydratase [candidate division WOR-3 bacterium]|uniref:dTDP-glucose 4,6-dehydratase n=1 Tax=candidate division WOR-3 bacterium TaxID=2052148 RepID=A0A7V0XFF6_UNCW3|nr:dTDP-glucose 4,6-dehydratase [candidate division WOR-3 bacterium]